MAPSAIESAFFPQFRYKHLTLAVVFRTRAKDVRIKKTCHICVCVPPTAVEFSKFYICWFVSCFTGLSEIF